MSEDKKPLSNLKNSGLAGGLGSILTIFVPAILPDVNNPWRPVLYALAPLLAASIAYFFVWFINRHGLEGPEEARLRNRYEGDLKNIDKQLEHPLTTESLRAKLLTEREQTIVQLVSIGRNVKVSASKEDDTTD